MIEIYDNGGETFDRYTVIIDGDVYGMSDNPLSPQGFNQFSGKLHELPLARQGERLTIESLPEAVQTAIERRAGNDDLNVPMALHQWCETITDNKATLMGSDGMVNGEPSFQTEFERDGRKWEIHIISKTNNHE